MREQTITEQYALIARNTFGKRVGNALVTSKPAFTLHGSVTPAMHTLCASMLALIKGAQQVDVIHWSPGIELESVPVLMVARSGGEKGQIGYEIRDTRYEKEHATD